MTLRATRTIGTGDGWDVTTGGIYVPDWADLGDVRPQPVTESAERPPIGIDLFAGAGGFSCGFKQAGWHVVAANENDVDAAHTYLCNLGSPDTRIVFCTPEDEQRWHQRHKRLERYHAQPDRAPLEPGSGWIAGQTGVAPCEVFFFGDVRALTGELGLEGDEVGCVFGGRRARGSPKRAAARPTIHATSWCSSSCGSCVRSTRAASAWRTCPGCSTCTRATASR